MKTDLRNILNFVQFLEKYTKIIQFCNDYLSDLKTLFDPLVFAKSLIKNMLEILSLELDVARKRRR